MKLSAVGAAHAMSQSESTAGEKSAPNSSLSGRDVEIITAVPREEPGNSFPGLALSIYALVVLSTFFFWVHPKN